jgi:4-amino-4-deoxy-L-arabinose transferase-like glycosyltransferase
MDRRVEQRGARPWMLALALVFAVGLGLRVGAAWNPYQPQLPDARAYARLAESLYLDGTYEQRGDFVPRDLQDPENYSPGLPLFVAGIYHLAGGVDLRLARLVLAMIGALAIPLAFLIGRHLAGPAAGLVAAVPVAVYPALLDYQGMLMTEPLATTLLAAGVLGFIWAADGRGAVAWAVPGLLFGLLAMVRPEYLPFGFLLALLALLLVRRRSGPRAGVAVAAVMLAAFALPVIPWTIRNALVLDRFVPISTGGGKALFIGTYLPADGDGVKLQQELLEQDPALLRSIATEHAHEVPSQPSQYLLTSQLNPPADGIAARQRISQRFTDADFIYLETVLQRVAARSHPGVSTDVALARMGKENLRHDLSDHPGRFAEMLSDKTYDAWRYGPRAIMRRPVWAALHLAVVLGGLAGFLLLAWRRRWEALLIGLLLLGATATSTLLIASPRRVTLMVPLLSALAGAAAVWTATWVRSHRPGDA